MSIKAISYAQITDLFILMLAQITTKQDAQTALDAMPARPELPQFVDEESDYNSAVTAGEDWDAEKLGYENSIAAAEQAYKSHESQMLQILPPNIWFRLDVDLTPESNDYYWIGYNTNDTPGYIQYLRYLHQDLQPDTPLTHNMDA